MFTAEMAREMVAKNNKRKKIINELIERTEKSIRNACNDGERETVLYDSQYNYEEPYIEVHKHFKELGFEIKRYRDDSGYYITW